MAEASVPPPKRVSHRFINLVGQIFGRLIVTDRAPSIPARQAYWICTCQCGEVVTIAGGNLRSGSTQSCGCLHRERASAASRTHGHTANRRRSATYYIWGAMIARCHNPTHKDFKYYGARGISVSREWRDFAQFFADMGERPPGMSLDRIDNERGYESGNARWSTRREQANNMRTNIRVEIGGANLSLTEFARAMGVPAGTLWYRVQRASQSPIRAAMALRRRKEKRHRVATSSVSD